MAWEIGLVPPLRKNKRVQGGNQWSLTDIKQRRVSLVGRGLEWEQYVYESVRSIGQRKVQSVSSFHNNHQSALPHEENFGLSRKKQGTHHMHSKPRPSPDIVRHVPREEAFRLRFKLTTTALSCYTKRELGVTPFTINMVFSSCG